MAAVGKSIVGVESVPANGNIDNLIRQKPGQVLEQDSSVEIFLTREAVGVEFTVTIGGDQVYPKAPANINAVNGTLPSVRDDRIISVFGDRSDPIIILVSNSTGAPLEARALVKLMPIGGLQLRGGRTG